MGKGSWAPTRCLTVSWGASGLKRIKKQQPFPPGTNHLAAGGKINILEKSVNKTSLLRPPVTAPLWDSHYPSLISLERNSDSLVLARHQPPPPHTLSMKKSRPRETEVNCRSLRASERWSGDLKPSVLSSFEKYSVSFFLLI